MIGNYILFEEKIIKINFITEVSIGWGNDNFAPSDTRLGSFKPIPLDFLILDKLGFHSHFNIKEKKTEYHIGFNSTHYFVREVGDAHKHWYLYYALDKQKRITSNIRYVHELQNIYLLMTGKELTMSL